MFEWPDDIAYISVSGEFTYCHKCGMYLVLSDHVMCAKCRHIGEEEAKRDHLIMHELRRRITGNRKKVFPNKNFWTRVRMRRNGQIK